jgi:hypothetical protein
MADIFVSYASPDRDAAFRIVGFLEEQGISCWVAPRDVPPGVEYGEAIINGIEQSRALVLILSDQSNESQFVRKEVERAVSKTRPVLPVRIREVTPSGSLEFFISSAQWVDAWKSPMEQHLLPLVAAIKAMGQPGAPAVRSATLPPPRRSRMPLFAGVAIAAVLVVAVGAWMISSRRPESPAPVASVQAIVPAPAPSAPSAQTAPMASSPPPPAPAPTASQVPRRGDVAFVTGSWCQPYQGMMIRYNVLKTGPDTVLTQVNHPQAPPFESPSRVVAIKGGFEFRPVDEAPGDKNVARFTIVDDSTMKLVWADGAAQDGVVRMRCPATADR